MKTETDNMAGRYLLGKLTDEERTEIEQRYFHDKNLFEEILIAENELIDAYAAGRLSAGDRRLFESRLLLNPKQRQRVGFAKALIEYASNRPLAAQAPGSAGTKPSWTAVVSRLLSGKPALAFAFAATLLVLFGGIWMVLDKRVMQTDRSGDLAVSRTPPQQAPDEMIPNETDDAQENIESDPGALPPPRGAVERQKTPPIMQKTPKIKESPRKKASPRVFSLILLPVLTRDAATSRKHTIPPKTDFVKISLKFEETNFSSFQAILETVEGSQVWRSGSLKSGNGKSVDVFIPAKVFKHNDFILSLKGRTKDGMYESVADYSFTISP